MLQSSQSKLLIIIAANIFLIYVYLFNTNKQNEVFLRGHYNAHAEKNNKKYYVLKYFNYALHF